MDLLEKLDPKLLEQLEQVTVVQPGDKLIFKVSGVTTRAHAEEVQGYIRAALGEDLRFLIMGEGNEVFVLRAEN